MDVIDNNEDIISIVGKAFTAKPTGSDAVDGHDGMIMSVRSTLTSPKGYIHIYNLSPASVLGSEITWT